MVTFRISVRVSVRVESFRDSFSVLLHSSFTALFHVNRSEL